MSESLKPKVDPTRFGLRGIWFHRGWRGIDCGRFLKPSTAGSWLLWFCASMLLVGCASAEESGGTPSPGSDTPSPEIQQWEHRVSAGTGSVSWSLGSLARSSWLPPFADAGNYPPLATLGVSYSCGGKAWGSDPDPHPRVDLSFSGHPELDWPDTDWWSLLERERSHWDAIEETGDEWIEWITEQPPNTPPDGHAWRMSRFPADHPVWFDQTVHFDVGNTSASLTGELDVDVRVPWPEGEEPDSAITKVYGMEPMPDSKPSWVTITVNFDFSNLSVRQSDEVTARTAATAWGLVDSYGDSPMTATMHLDGVTYTAEFDMPPLDPPFGQATEFCSQ